MRIGTWNLEYARGAAKNLRRRALLEGVDADVWVLTETHDQLRLGADYQPVSSTPRPDRPDERWVTIWSRLPILQVVAMEDPCRTAAALLATESGPLLVVGTVVPWHSDRGADGTLRNWSEHHRVIPEQGAEWLRLLAAFPGARLCVAGDLSTTVDASGYGTRQGRALLGAALDAADLVCLTRATEETARIVARPFIDHVCLGRSLESGVRIAAAWEGTVDGVKLSDHSAVVVEVPA